MRISQMKRTIDFGKINLRKYWGNPKAKKDCSCHITVELSPNGANKTKFMATADVYDSTSELPLLWGDCLHELAKTELQSNDLFIKIYTLYCKYHNNDIHAGTPEQEIALRTAVAENIIPSLDIAYHNMHKEYLQSINLYTIILNDGTPYTYGQGWLYRPIPTTDVEIIHQLLERGY